MVLGICARSASLGISDGEPSSRNTMVSRYYIGAQMKIARTRVTQMPKGYHTTVSPLLGSAKLSVG